MRKSDIIAGETYAYLGQWERHPSFVEHGLGKLTVIDTKTEPVGGKPTVRATILKLPRHASPADERKAGKTMAVFCHRLVSPWSDQELRLAFDKFGRTALRDDPAVYWHSGAQRETEPNGYNAADDTMQIVLQLGAGERHRLLGLSSAKITELRSHATCDDLRQAQACMAVLDRSRDTASFVISGDARGFTCKATWPACPAREDLEAALATLDELPAATHQLRMTVNALEAMRAYEEAPTGIAALLGEVR